MTDPITATVVLGYIAIKIVDSLIGKGVDETVDAGINALSGENVQKSFKLCLAEAIHRYSTSGNRLALAKPLLSKNSPLLQEDVAHELAQTLKFDREPNYELIAKRWQDTIEDLPQWRDMNFEARLLARYLTEELQSTEIFGPVFDSKNLNAINENFVVTSTTLANIETDIENLISLLESRFGDLIKVFSGATYDINAQIRDFSIYIEEKTQDFVGRQFVFGAVEQFCREHTEGYLFVKGDPGIGKTALAAQYVKQKGCLHHFNSRPLGINRAEMFLMNICAQLIATYQLNYSFLPPDATQDSQFLIRILNEVSEKLKGRNKAIILVDALDEVDDASSLQGANLLFLPPSLPIGVYFIVTTRNTDLRLRIECDQQTFLLEQDAQENRDDIREFISARMISQGIQEYISSESITNEEFLDLMTQKSQGNFMYLRYVIPGIEHGLYKDLRLEALPVGLQSYYEDHWRRMRIQSENNWLEYKLPILVALSIVKEPVPVDLISKFSRIKDMRHVNAVLREWQQFLYQQKVAENGVLQKRYRVYHDSFREFIASRDEVEGEHVNLKKAHGYIADELWHDLFGNDPGKGS
jgi:hypothetical protein